MHPFTRWMQKRSPSGIHSEYEPHDGSRSLYFRNKQIKLDNQARASIELESHIFSGCVVYITGYTDPSSAELKCLIVSNGGQICSFLGGKTYATHIVASSLTARKREQYAHYVVVTPQWVVDSVASGRRLDWTKYNLLNEPLPDRVTVEQEEGEQGEQSQRLQGEQGEQGEQAPDPGPAGEGDLKLRSEQIQWILAQRSRVDCTSPSFVRDYFRNSRLHFISTCKLRLRRRCREYTQLLREQEQTRPPGVTPLRRTLLHVDFDSFFVSVALKRRPELKTAPVCVGFGSPQSDIASCNYVAREHGVRNGMWFAKAKELCPALVCLPYDFDEYEKCSNLLYDVLLSLKPCSIVALSVDEAVLDVSEHELQSPEQLESLCTQIRTKVRALTGIEVSVGAGNNVLMCRLALRKAKPAGQHFIKSLSEIQDFKVGDLPHVGFQTEQKLHSLNCLTVKDLQRVPLAKLQAELGSALGQKLYLYALGMDTVDISVLDQPVRSVGLDLGWGVRTVNLAEMDQFVLNCVQELHLRLVEADLTGGEGSCVYTVKVRQKLKSAPFLTTKYMGHGPCDVCSRTQTVPLKLSLEQLQQTTRELVKEIICLTKMDPLNFRGLGLHLKLVPGQKSNNTLHNYFNVVSAKDGLETIRSPKSSPTKKKMYAVPPRQKQKRETLTQLFVARSNGLPPKHEVDMSVLAELPAHVRQQVIKDFDLEEGLTTAPPRAPIALKAYANPSLFGLRGSALRRALKAWVNSSVEPSLEDSKLVFQYLSELASNARFTDALDLADWLRFASQENGEFVSEGWQVLVSAVDAEVQRVVNLRTHLRQL